MYGENVGQMFPRLEESIFVGGGGKIVSFISSFLGYFLSSFFVYNCFVVVKKFLFLKELRMFRRFLSRDFSFLWNVRLGSRLLK